MQLEKRRDIVESESMTNDDVISTLFVRQLNSEAISPHPLLSSLSTTEAQHHNGFRKPSMDRYSIEEA